MTITLAFDVYGTLIDTQGVTGQLQEYIPELAIPFAEKWRDKQLEYSFRRGLMDCYAPFSDCIATALDYCCDYYCVTLSTAQKQTLLDCYRKLPAFADTQPGLQALTEIGGSAFAFSNGTEQAVTELLKHANIASYFKGVVSVDDIKTFKPNPAVYHYFLQKTDADAQHSWLISSNPFDIIGASQCGMNTAWVKRAETAIFDPWGIQPALVIGSLTELPQVIAGMQ